MKTCSKGKPCGLTCIKKTYACPVNGEVTAFRKCKKGKVCGKVCIPKNKKCKDEKKFLKALEGNDQKTWWKQKYQEAEAHLEDGYPAPRQACASALQNLQQDIITLEDKDKPSRKDCHIAKYLCHPGRTYYGGSQCAAKQAKTKCNSRNRNS